MTMQNSDCEVSPEPPPYDHAMHRLDKLQSDLIIAARMLAFEEVGAQVAHQLNEPLTALLAYLNELELARERSAQLHAAPMPVWEIVAKAAHEVERACNILERTRSGVEASVDTRSAVTLGRQAVGAWARMREARGGERQFLATSVATPLTPREQEVLAQITAGATNKEGSHNLGISVRTFEVHRAHIMRKFGARNAADLVRTVLTNTK
jgi:DNA-binding CsgD family transcriptional regulator